MNHEPTEGTLRGPDLWPWTFWCDNGWKTASAQLVRWRVLDERFTYFTFTCGACSRVHTQGLDLVMSRMERAWAREVLANGSIAAAG